MNVIQPFGELELNSSQFSPMTSYNKCIQTANQVTYGIFDMKEADRTQPTLRFEICTITDISQLYNLSKQFVAFFNVHKKKTVQKIALTHCISHFNCLSFYSKQ